MEEKKKCWRQLSIILWNVVKAWRTYCVLISSNISDLHFVRYFAVLSRDRSTFFYKYSWFREQKSSELRKLLKVLNNTYINS